MCSVMYEVENSSGHPIPGLIVIGFCNLFGFINKGRFGWIFFAVGQLRMITEIYITARDVARVCGPLAPVPKITRKRALNFREI